MLKYDMTLNDLELSSEQLAVIGIVTPIFAFLVWQLLKLTHAHKLPRILFCILLTSLLTYGLWQWVPPKPASTNPPGPPPLRPTPPNDISESESDSLALLAKSKFLKSFPHLSSMSLSFRFDPLSFEVVRHDAAANIGMDSHHIATITAMLTIAVYDPAQSITVCEHRITKSLSESVFDPSRDRTTLKSDLQSRLNAELLAAAEADSVLTAALQVLR
jgi:hypothetical protein